MLRGVCPASYLHMPFVALMSGVLQVARLAEQSRRLQGQLHDFLPSHLNGSSEPEYSMPKSSASSSTAPESQQEDTGAEQDDSTRCLSTLNSYQDSTKTASQKILRNHPSLLLPVPHKCQLVLVVNGVSAVQLCDCQGQEWLSFGPLKSLASFLQLGRLQSSCCPVLQVMYPDGCPGRFLAYATLDLSP